MVEIKGKLSSLFERLYSKNIKLTDSLLESMINRPIIKDGRCMGIIKSINKDKDEWSGFLFDTLEVGISVDTNTEEIYVTSANLLSL